MIYSPAQVFLRMEPKDVPDDLLVAVLLSGTTGNRNAAEVARWLLQEAQGDISQIAHHFPTRRGVGAAGQARLKAAIELYRRANYRALAGKGAPVRAPEDAVEVLRSMALGDYEQLVALYLDRRHRIIATRGLTKGSAAFTVVDPRQVFRPAVQFGASAVILAHNHPSGNPEPSPQDYQVTDRVEAAGKVLGIPLLDHFVLVRGGEDGWSSVKLGGARGASFNPRPTVEDLREAFALEAEGR
jgi:DNA repair protein RadC